MNVLAYVAIAFSLLYVGGDALRQHLNTQAAQASEQRMQEYRAVTHAAQVKACNEGKAYVIMVDGKLCAGR